MFGHRVDGKKVKKMDVISKAEPFFMPMRIDAVNYIKVEIPCAPLDDFIARERKLGNNYTYFHIALTTIVRLMYIRPKHNRFVVNGIVYDRKGVQISMDVKKELSDEGEDMTLKFDFTGRENIAQVKQIVDTSIKENIEKGEDATTRFIKKLTWTPAWVLRAAIGLFRWMDKHGMLTKGMVKASPFHTSCFFTHLKSIRLGYIYHHLYNFGTTSMFAAMGKERVMPVVENNKDVKAAKMLELGISLDERIADGYYMAKSLRFLKDLLANPDNLNDAIPENVAATTKIKRKKKGAKKTKSVKPKKTKETNKRKSRIKKDHSLAWRKKRKSQDEAIAEE